MAHTTQFTAPGWQYLDSSTRLPRRQPQQRQLRHAEVAEQLATTARSSRRWTPTAAQTLDLNVTGGLSTGAVHVWSTNLELQQPGRLLRPRQPTSPRPAARFSLTAAARLRVHDHHHDRAGQGHRDQPGAGLARACRTATTSTPTPSGERRKYLQDMQGAFEIAACGGGRSGHVRAPDVARRRRSPGRPSADPYALLRQPELEQLHGLRPTCCWRRPATPSCWAGSAGSDLRPGARCNAYYLRVTDTGAWSILRNNTSRRRLTTLRSGTHRRAGHQPLAHPGARLLRQHHHRHRRRRRRSAPSPTPPSAPARSASAPARARPRSSTTSPSPPVAGGGGGADRGRCAASAPTGASTYPSAAQTNGTAAEHLGLQRRRQPAVDAHHGKQLQVYGTKCLDAPGTPRRRHPGDRSRTATAAPTSSGTSTPTARSSGSSPGCAWTRTAPAPATARGDRLDLQRRQQPEVDPELAPIHPDKGVR